MLQGAINMDRIHNIMLDAGAETVKILRKQKSTWSIYSYVENSSNNLRARVFLWEPKWVVTWEFDNENQFLNLSINGK